MKRCISAWAFALALVNPAFAAEKPFEVDKLATGLEVVSMASSKVPLVTIVLASKAGGMTETPETNGLTHLWEHMFFKGNKRLPDQEAFNKRIRELGIVYNGDTSAEKVRYYFTLPSVFLEEGLQFMADAISTPLLDQKELEKERRVVIDEYDRAAANPGFDMRNLFRTIIYGDLHYLRDPLGHRYLIEKATREQLFAIKDEVFVPSNSALFVSGDFDKPELIKLVNKYFANWKNPKDWKPVKRPDFPPFPKTTEFLMTRENVRNADIQIVLEGPKARSQPQDTFAADVLISLLDHKSGKFYQKFVDSGMTYGAGVGYYTQSQAGQILLYASTKPEAAEDVKKALLAEVNEWTKPGYFTEAQLEDVRRKLTINHKRDLNQPSAYIKTLAFWWPVTGLDYYSSYLESMQKTDINDVNQFVKKWMVKKPYVSGILVSPQDAKKAKLKDTSGPLVKKHLQEYLNPKAS